jgi:MFS family permease
MMSVRNRLGLYGSYFLGMAGIGFTLPFLPLFLAERGLSDRAIGFVSTIAAVAGLAQFPLGVWSDHIGRRKPFLIAALALLAVSMFALPLARNAIVLSLLVVLFAENGLCRATVESFAGAEAAHLAPKGEIGRALGMLRFWRPVAIVLVALIGGLVVEKYGLEAMLWPLAVIQTLAVLAALLIQNDKPGNDATSDQEVKAAHGAGRGFRDPVLWTFVLAMVLFHVGNAPGGVYLGLYLKRELHAPDRYLPYAFIISMVAWMLAIRLVGRIADQMGRRPLLIVGWAVMSLRLGLIAIAQTAEQVLAVQILDGVAQSLFAVTAAAWVTDRLADPRRVGEAQVLVGSALVFGSAVGPLLSGLVIDSLGYRGTFGLLGGIGAIATLIVTLLIPETLSDTNSSPVVAEVAA